MSVFVLAVALASCAGDDEIRTEVDNLSEAYETAKLAIQRKNFRKGIQIFEAIQARFPFSDLSRQIALELMHAYYQAGQREQAIESATTFIRENPTHARVDYALYIEGLSHYQDGVGLLERWFRQDTSQRPPEGLGLAYTTFRRLVDRYPASEYAPDSEQRMIAIKDRLAEYENHVADFYLRRGAYVAAANRAKSALEDYHGAVANERSLEIMITAYESLGMDDLASDAQRVKDLNFPSGS